MTDFVYPDPIETQAWDSAALGTCRVDAGNTASTAWTAADAGRALVFGANQAMTEAGAGVVPEGFLMSVEPFTVNGGASFGSVKRKGRVRVKAAGAITINTFIQTHTTAPDRGATETLALVAASAGTSGWRYIRKIRNSSGTQIYDAVNASANAAVGDEILIERI